MNVQDQTHNPRKDEPLKTPTDCIENILKLLMSKPGVDAIYFRTNSPEAALLRSINNEIGLCHKALDEMGDELERIGGTE